MGVSSRRGWAMSLQETWTWLGLQCLGLVVYSLQVSSLGDSGREEGWYNGQQRTRENTGNG